MMKKAVRTLSMFASVCPGGDFAALLSDVCRHDRAESERSGTVGNGGIDGFVRCDGVGA